jgi:methylthioribose-1-phosphate isomerase
MVHVPTPTLARSVVTEPDTVRILDRRVFPMRRHWVVCRDYREVAAAIEEMVTQSLGPRYAVGGGLVLAAREADASGVTDRRRFMAEAGARLTATRPTNNHIRDTVRTLLAAVEPALDQDAPLEPAMRAAAAQADGRFEAGMRALGEAGAELIHDGDTVLTHCWGETYLTETVAAVLRAGKRISAICTETRPYLQGARLTAESLAEMTVPTTVVTDGMPAHLMSRGAVSVFVTGADRLTMDGHIVNKIGTLQLAIAAHTFGVPYYPLIAAPDPQAPTPDSIELEDRDGDEVLGCLGRRTASRLAAGLYPAFDVTPPRFVSAVVTDRGRFAPTDVRSYFR